MGNLSLSREGQEKLKTWLGKEGIKFFRDLQKKYKTVSPVWDEGGIPHCVHFREGMQIRNFLRTLPETKEWDCHTFDDNWQRIIEEAIA